MTPKQIVLFGNASYESALAQWDMLTDIDQQRTVIAQVTSHLFDIANGPQCFVLLSTANIKKAIA